MKIPFSFSTRQFPSHTRGVILILSGTVFFSLMSLGVRLGRDRFNSETLVFTRSFVQTLLLLPWYRRYFTRDLSTQLRVHLPRGLFGVLSMFLLYLSLHYLPLALTTLLAMSSVVWAATLAWFFLNERFSSVQFGFAVVTGAGLVLSLLPHQGGFDGGNYSVIGISAGLLCGFFMGLALTTLRKMRRDMGTREIVFFFGICGMVLSAPFVLRDFKMPTDPASLALLLGIGIAATLGQCFMTAGFKYTPTLTATLVNLQQIILNVVLGLVVLGEVPPVTFVLGLGFALVGMVGLVRARVSTS